MKRAIFRQSQQYYHNIIRIYFGGLLLDIQKIAACVQNLNRFELVFTKSGPHMLLTVYAPAPSSSIVKGLECESGITISIKTGRLEEILALQGLSLLFTVEPFCSVLSAPIMHIHSYKDYKDFKKNSFTL